MERRGEGWRGGGEGGERGMSGRRDKVREEGGRRGRKEGGRYQRDVERREMCVLGAAMVVWDNWLGWEVEDGIADLAR